MKRAMAKKRIDIEAGTGSVFADLGYPDAKEPLLHFFIERYKQAYVDELNEFIDVVETKAKPSVDFEDGRRALIIADAAWEATRTGRAVRWSTVRSSTRSASSAALNAIQTVGPFIALPRSSASRARLE